VTPPRASIGAAGRLVAIALVTVSAACTTGKGSNAGGQATGPTPITIGVLAGLTGQGAVDAAEMRLNVDLAITQTNASGGIAGHPLQAVYADTGGDAQSAVGEARQLVAQQHASVLVGGVLSAECMALAHEAAQLKVVYMTASGCPTADLTAQHCNAYTFRLMPAGGQVAGPLARYVAGKFGPHWAIIYPDYAFGRTQLQLYQTALTAAGADPPLAIAVPLGEQDPSPYVDRVREDSAVNGVINLEDGADLTAINSALRESGIADRLPIVFSGSKERFGGAYPADVDGFIFATTHLSTPESGGGADKTYEQAFAEQVLKEPQLAELLGGPGKSVAGQSGYQAYATMSALRLSMLDTGFTGSTGTPKLIEALASMEAPEGPDLPGGAVRMNAADHQGAATLSIARVSGQEEQLLQTVPAQDVPSIGSCKVS
jgi:ABC-type branched-subunit amino acid transport system substrate-binding protein